MEINIKPCPHCGGTAAIDHNYNPKTDCYFFKVKCELCGATGKATSATPGEEGQPAKAVRRAVLAWNMRTPAAV